MNSCSMLQGWWERWFIAVITRYTLIFRSEGSEGRLVALGGSSRLQLSHLLVEVFVKFVTVDEGGIRFLELVAVKVYEYGLEVVN